MKKSTRGVMYLLLVVMTMTPSLSSAEKRLQSSYRKKSSSEVHVPQAKGKVTGKELPLSKPHRPQIKGKLLNGKRNGAIPELNAPVTCTPENASTPECQAVTRRPAPSVR